MVTLMNGILDPYLAALIAAEFSSSGTTIHLFSNNITPAPTDNVGMYTEATYSTYAAQTVFPFASPSGGSSGTSSAVGTPAVFAPGVLGSPQDCYGWYMVDSNGNFVAADVFAGGPRNMGGTTVSVTITPTLTLA